MKRRKLLSLLVAAAMVLSLLPMSALAAEGTEGTMTQAALEAEIAAVPAGGTVTLTGDVDVTAPIVITKELTLNLAGNTLSNQNDIWDDTVNNWSLISVRAGGDLTITGSGTLQAKENDCYAVDVMDGGICTIENGTFDGNIHAVYVFEGMLVVNGGAFSVQQKYTDSSKADEFVLNCYDDHYRNGSASILVTGGTFENFNPSNCQAEGAGTSFMSADCKVAESTSGEVTIYTVTKNQTITVNKPNSVSGGTVSATVGGESIPTDTGTGDVVTSDQTVTVDAKVDGASDVTAANVTVGGGALTAVKGVASKLAIETNVGTLTINGGALDAITANATVGGTVTDVTLSIQNTTAQDAAATTAAYELTAVDANGGEVFNSENAGGAITVTVPAPKAENAEASETYYIYYLGADGAELVKSAQPDANGNISWDAEHFSTYYVTATEQKVSVSDGNGNTATYDTLQEAIDNAKAGDTVKLMSNVTVDAPSGDGSGLAAITIDRNIILDGGGNTINIGTDFAATGGNDWDADLGKYHVINITSDATIQNVTIDGGWAGKDAESSNDYSAARSGINIWNNDPTRLVVTLDGVKVNNCSTYAVTARGTDLTITDMATTGSQWGVNVEDNSTVTIENSTIPEDIVYESSSSNSSLAIDGGDYGTVKVQQQDDAVTTGTVTVENATVEEVVTGGDKVSEATATISVTGSTVGTVTNTSKGTFSVAGSQITGAVPEAGDNIIMVGCTDENNSALTDVVPGNKEAMIDGTTYGTLEDALAEAQDGDVVFLLNDATLNGSGKGNNTGIVEITKNITIEGNGKTITAESVTADETTAAGPSMITIKGGANVTVRDLIIDGAGGTDATTDNTKHGLNIYGDGTTVTVENVQIRNGNGYAIVANGADVTVDGLITENNGWGGINVDSKSGAASLTIEDADISERNSVKIENTAADSKPADPTVEINDGSFQYVTVGDEINKEDLGLTISGGKFATATEGAPTGALTRDELEDCLTGNLALDGNGNVYTPSQGGSSGGSTRYAVTAPSNVSNGAVTVSPSRASYNQTVTITVTPDEGYELSSLTVTTASGSTISLTKVSDTRYTFTMPRSAVTISASFAEEQLVSSLPFTDVSVDDWFYDMVEYVYDNGIMTGTSGTTFEPNATLTRAMMATVLWAMEGNPTSGSGSYTDVSSGDWYYNAVRWATSAGVVNGVGDNTFAPNDPLTREQMAVMLYAYAVYKGYDTAASTAAESFNDSGEISGWALTAMNWAVDNGLLGGKPGNLLDPTGSATRAEIATILRNFCENIVK